MADDRHPDQGDAAGCRSAAWAVQDIGALMMQSRLEATSAAAMVTPAVWSGHAAQAFLATADTVDHLALTTADGWSRLSEALTGYAPALEALQEEGDILRRRLAAAEEDRDTYQRGLTRARQSALSGDPTATAQVSTLSRLLADAGVDEHRAWADLEDLADQRRRLDDRSAAEILASPGPGAAAWVGLACRANGSVRSTEEIVDDLLDLLDGPDRPSVEDYRALEQFLAMYSGDPAAMSRFYAGLGPDGVAWLLAGMTADSMVFQMSGAESLPLLLTTGLTTASLTWDDATADEWGRGLVNTILDSEFGAADDQRLVVSLLLGADGLNPQVAVAAFLRVEELRTTDPTAFARVAPEGDLFSGDLRAARERLPAVSSALGDKSGDLMGAVFAQLARVPGAAQELFAGDGSVIDYWFGQRDWRADAFEGPAVLLDAVVNSPEAVRARALDPLGAVWSEVVGFASVAAERLGGNLNLRVGVMSSQASLDVAEALAVFIPETAEMLANGIDIQGESDQRVLALIGGQETIVPALTTQWGNLARLLGVATTDVSALAAYSRAVGNYGRSVIDYVCSSDHPGAERSKDLLHGVGHLYGFAYAAGAYEGAKHAETISDREREALGWISAAAGLVPGVDTGTAVGDYLFQVVTGQVETIGASLDPAIMSDIEIRSVLQTGLEEGNAALNDSVTDALDARWSGIEPQYDTTLDTLVSRVTDGYATRASAGAADVTVDELSVVVLGEDEARSRIEMP